MSKLQRNIQNYKNIVNTKTKCQKCSVNTLCLPSGLSSSELLDLDKVIAPSKIVDKNKPLFSYGEKFDSLYVVHSGMFKSTTVNEEGKERIISFHLPGEVMGLDGIHSDFYESTVTALTMSSYCKIPYKQLMDLSIEHPVIQQNLLKVMSKEIYSCKKNHIDIGSTAKLALFIKTLSYRFEIRGYSGKEFFLPISQRDIANYLGMAEETLSRVFKKLQKSEMVKYKKHILTILKKEELENIAES